MKKKGMSHMILVMLKLIISQENYGAKKDWQKIFSMTITRLFSEFKSWRSSANISIQCHVFSISVFCCPEISLFITQKFHLSNSNLILSISLIMIMIQMSMIVLLGLVFIGSKVLPIRNQTETNQSGYPNPGSTNYSPYGCYCYNYKNTFPVGLATVIQERVFGTVCRDPIFVLTQQMSSMNPDLRESLLWIWKMKFLRYLLIML